RVPLLRRAVGAGGRGGAGAGVSRPVGVGGRADDYWQGGGPQPAGDPGVAGVLGAVVGHPRHVPGGPADGGGDDRDGPLRDDAAGGPPLPRRVRVAGPKWGGTRGVAQRSLSVLALASQFRPRRPPT